MNSKIYDIDNFVIQSSALKIHQKYEKLDIPIPVFKEIHLEEDIYNHFKFESFRDDEDFLNKEVKFFIKFQEDTSEAFYNELHKVFEQREREYCLSFYKKKKDRSNDSVNYKFDKADQITITGVSNCDNLTAKSNDDNFNSNMKIRINLNILSNSNVKI